MKTWNHLTNEAPEHVRRQTNELFHFIQQRAEKESIIIGPGFPEECTGFWDDYTDCVYLDYLNSDEKWNIGGCRPSLEFLGHTRMISFSLTVSPYNGYRQYGYLQKISALIMTYMDENVSYQDAVAFVDQLWERESTGYHPFGDLKAYMVVQTGDFTMIDITYKI